MRVSLFVFAGALVPLTALAQNDAGPQRYECHLDTYCSAKGCQAVSDPNPHVFEFQTGDDSGVMTFRGQAWEVVVREEQFVVSFIDYMEQGFRGYAIDKMLGEFTVVRGEPGFTNFHTGRCELQLSGLSGSRIGGIG